MILNNNELVAIVRLGVAMSEADGNVDDMEVAAVKAVLQLLNVDGNSIVFASEGMSGTDAISILAKMSTEKKKYAMGFLMLIMKADGVIADEEVDMLNLIRVLADCDTIDIDEALTYFCSYHGIQL